MKWKVLLMTLITSLIIYINESTYNSLNSIMKNNLFDKVREFENVVERTIVFTRANYANIDNPPQSVLTTTKEFKESVNSLNSKVEKVEKNPVIHTLKKEDSDKSQSEQLFKLSEQKLKYKPYKSRDIRHSKLEILV